MPTKTAPGAKSRISEKPVELVEGVPNSFRKYGNLFTLVRRDGPVATYKRENDEGEHRGFEVVILRVRPPAVINGLLVKGGECYPSSSQWGVFGWTYLREAEALAKAKHDELSLRLNPKPEKHLTRRR